MITRLTDPNNLAEDKFNVLADKISVALTRLSRRMPTGSPFHYAYLAPAVHELTNIIPTAATNGRKYYWNPSFLDSLTPDQVNSVLIHEAYHTVLFHTARGNTDPLWNVAVDFVVNAILLVDHNIPLAMQFTQHFTIAEIKNAIASGEGVEGIALDRTAHGRTAEEIYDELLRTAQQTKSNRNKDGQTKAGSSDGGHGKSLNEPGGSPLGSFSDEPDTFKPKISGGFDDHGIKSEQNPQEVSDQIREALSQAAAIGGALPPGSVAGLLEGALIKLEKAEVDLKTMIYGMATKIQAARGGLHLDYKRPRRRSGFMPLNNGRVTMIPVRAKKPIMHYAVCMDTSGSMSDHDINRTVSQLQSLNDTCRGFVVPNDTEPYWDSMAEITNTFDLTKVRVKGRGGTDYGEFFRTYRNKIDKPDFLVVLTDGGVSVPPKPPTPIIWVVVGCPSFSPGYGKVVNLR